ncbi:hypothetical protein [Nocardioides zeae]
MSWIEWAGIPAGIISGGLSGWAAAWIGRPKAQANAEVAAEQERQRLQARRNIIEKGRALVDLGREHNLTPAALARETGFDTVRPHLSPTIKATYTWVDRRPVVDWSGLLNVGWEHNDLADDIARLEKEWGLV